MSHDRVEENITLFKDAERLINNHGSNNHHFQYGNLIETSRFSMYCF